MGFFFYEIASLQDQNYVAIFLIRLLKKIIGQFKKK